MANVNCNKDKVLNAQKQNDAIRQWWNQTVCNEFGVPKHYQSVAVLLINWAPRLDKDLNCGAETERLRKVFEDQFGFTTEPVLLDCLHKRPEAQLGRDIANFIYKYDGPYRTHLLIVYYSGHGYLKEDESKVDRLFISGEKPDEKEESQNHSRRKAICDWEAAECLLKRAEADVLTIVDSCYSAAGINKSTIHAERAFETLAAAQTKTRGPGPESFTQALIESLTELHEDAAQVADRPFDTSRLHHEIMYRMRPHHVLPPLFNRHDRTNARHICLAPLMQPANLQPQTVKPTSAVLRLQIALSNCRSLDEQETKRLASSLVAGARNSGLEITTVDFGEFVPISAVRVTFRVAEILGRWIWRWRHRKRSKEGVARDVLACTSTISRTGSDLSGVSECLLH